MKRTHVETNMMMNSKKLRTYSVISTVAASHSPPVSLSLTFHHRLFELSFVSFNTRNKIWRKIITEIKALIFFFRVVFFWVGVAGTNFRNDVIILCECVGEIRPYAHLSDAFGC